MEAIFTRAKNAKEDVLSFELEEAAKTIDDLVELVKKLQVEIGKLKERQEEEEAPSKSPLVGKISFTKYTCPGCDEPFKHLELRARCQRCDTAHHHSCVEEREGVPLRKCLKPGCGGKI